MDKLQQRIDYLEEVYTFTLEALQRAGEVGNFQPAQSSFDTAASIAAEILHRANGLFDAEAMAVYLVDENSSDFYLAACTPDSAAPLMDVELEYGVDCGNVCTAMERKSVFRPISCNDPWSGRRLIMHSIATASRIRGLFVAVPPKNVEDIPDSSLHLLSILLLNAANSLESFELYRLLSEKNTQLEHNIAQLQEKQIELEEQQSLFRQLFDNSPLAIALLDLEGRIELVNHGYEQLFGYSSQEVQHKMNSSLIVSPEAQIEVLATRKTLLAGRCLQRETQRLRKDGTAVDVSMLGMPVFRNNKVHRLFFMYQDISERKEHEEQLAHQAFHDALTGLPNRYLFMERLERAVSRSMRNNEDSYAVLVVDLDRFKHINDSLGHLVGDQLLQAVAQRFMNCVRNVDTVARLGGDEFAVLLENIHEPQEAVRVARRFQASLQKPVSLVGEDIVCGASVGIVMHTMHYSSPEDLLRDADIAMYKAKEEGDGSYRVFDPAMYHKAQHTLQIETELRRALGNGELEVYYQPIYSLESQSLYGFEALARWNHPKRGLLPPSEFIPVAEETGLILPLGEWVLEEACIQAKRWNSVLPAQEQAIILSVNLSGRQLCKRSLPDVVNRVLEQSNAPAHCICLELTESLAMNDAQFTITALTRLKDLGLRIAIDDFGTGYSSLSYLHQLPIDALKIDKSFLEPGNGQANLPIVRAIVTLAQAMDLTVIAEGVEHENQVSLLAQLRCSQAQGFFFGRPLPATQAEAVRVFSMNGQRAN